MTINVRDASSRNFLRFAVTTALLTVGLIVFGAVVRVTDSGLGCGSSWPLCDGTIFPPVDNITAWIEWLHRLFAVLIGIFGLATLYMAFRAYRHVNRPVLLYTIGAAILFVIQSALGAIVVIFELPPTFVTLHLGTAMLLLGALLIAVMMAWYRPPVEMQINNQITALVYVNALFSLVIILTGALVRGSGATLACTDWPLCYGTILPTEYGQLAIIHMIHRFAVLAFGVALLLLVWQVYRQRSHSLIRRLAVASLILYLAQSGVGAMFVISVAGPEWGAVHVGLAATVWGLLVILGVVVSMNAQEYLVDQVNPQWNPQS